MFLTAFLKGFCEWCDQSFFGSAIRNSKWLFPFVEIFHLLALGMLGGTVLLINLRALGLRFRSDPVSEIARQVEPWMIASLAIMLASGFLLFSSEATRMYFNLAFRFKLKLAALLSLVLWSGVALAGRAIGYTRQVETKALSEMIDVVPHGIALNGVSSSPAPGSADAKTRLRPGANRH